MIAVPQTIAAIVIFVLSLMSSSSFGDEVGLLLFLGEYIPVDLWIAYGLAHIRIAGVLTLATVHVLTSFFISGPPMSGPEIFTYIPTVPSQTGD